jgi:hypothetical protein
LEHKNIPARQLSPLVRETYDMEIQLNKVLANNTLVRQLHNVLQVRSNHRVVVSIPLLFLGPPVQNSGKFPYKNGDRGKYQNLLR